MLIKKKNIFIMILVFVILLILLFLITYNNKIMVIKTKSIIYADNSSVSLFKIVYQNNLRQMFFPFNKKFDIKYISGKELIKEIKTENGFYLKSGVKTGKVSFTIETFFQKINEDLFIIDDYNDSDEDGIPDVVELDSRDDRTNFIDWFVSIAESQFYAKSFNWEEINQSCSGLVVFSFKEALKKHNDNWMKQYHFLANKNIPDVAKYNYPDVPILGDKIFRTKSGYFKKKDVDTNIFSETANANNLLNFNLIFIGKDKNLLQKGDVIFFNNTMYQDMPYHCMIYTGETDFLIYHTGPLSENNTGEVRKVSFENLMKHPDSVWHPVSNNSHFLGIYRWKIVM